MITASEANNMAGKVKLGLPAQDELARAMEHADIAIRDAAQRGRTWCTVSFQNHGMDPTRPEYKTDLTIRDHVCERLASHGFTFKVDPHFQQLVDVSW